MNKGVNYSRGFYFACLVEVFVVLATLLTVVVTSKGLTSIIIVVFIDES